MGKEPWVYELLFLMVLRKMVIYIYIEREIERERIGSLIFRDLRL